MYSHAQPGAPGREALFFQLECRPSGRGFVPSFSPLGVPRGKDVREHRISCSSAALGGARAGWLHREPATPRGREGREMRRESLSRREWRSGGESWDGREGRS